MIENGLRAGTLWLEIWEESNVALGYLMGIVRERVTTESKN